MELFEKTLGKIEENKQSIKSGKPNCIPFPFPRLRKHIAGIIKGVQYIVSANSGIGKSQFVKYAFVYHPIKYVLEHPEFDIKLKIMFFALEESKEEFMLGLIGHRLKEEYGLNVSLQQLQSFEKELDDEVVDKIKECREYFAKVAEYLDIQDGISNPTGIYKHVREYSYNNGTHYYRKLISEEKEVFITHMEYQDLSPGDKELYKYYEYKPHHPNEYVIVIVDHFSLISPEKSASTLHEAMSLMSATYGRKNITKHWKYIFVNVQQQSAAGENIEHYKAKRLEPTLDNLADNKLTGRDGLVVFGIFAPERYGLDTDLDGKIDVRRMKDNYRRLILLKNRIGTPNLHLPMFFNGLSNIWVEIPKEGPTEQFYKDVEDARRRNLDGKKV